MGKFDKVLLVSDFDGTLTGGDGNIPQRNVDAIMHFIDEGGLFTVSTGRTKIGFHNYSEKIINAPVLLGNGAMAYDYSKKEVVFTNTINSEVCEIFTDFVKYFPLTGIEIYTVDDRAFVVNPNSMNYAHYNGLRIDNFIVSNNIADDMFPAVKIMLSAGKAETFEVQKYLQKTDLKGMKYIPCTGAFVELLAVSAGKGNALFQLADALSVEHKDIYAVGDGSNDTDMLEAALVSFAPSGADALALNSANITVCSSDEGAVADTIAYLERNYC